MLLAQRHSPQEHIHCLVRKTLFDSSTDGRFQPKVIIPRSSSQKMRKTPSLIKTTSAIVRVRLHTIGSKSNFSSASFYPGWATGQLGLWGTKHEDLQSGLSSGACSLWDLIIQGISAGKKALWPKPTQCDCSLKNNLIDWLFCGGREKRNTARSILWLHSLLTLSSLPGKSV